MVVEKAGGLGSVLRPYDARQGRRCGVNMLRLIKMMRTWVTGWW
jgi:hypothetical protein